MQKNNTVFLGDKELADVVVCSDSRGNNNIMSSLKYNRLVNKQSASHLFNKNTLFVRNKQLKDTLIVSDCHGNNTITTMSETSDSGERNVFMEVLHRVQREHSQATIDDYLQKKRQTLQDKLKMATDLYLSGNFSKSLEYYRHALTMIESDSYPDEFRLEKNDVFRIKYALILSKIGLNLYGPLKTACEMCSTLILTYGAEYPSLYFTLGRAKVLLQLYESARIVLGSGLSVLGDCVVLSHLTFPASNQIIPDTDPTTLLHNLEKTLEDAQNVPKPDVKCCNRLCIGDSRAIYFNGPSFIGYVNVTCSERCQYNYHRACWKRKLKTDRVKKPSAILNERCPTDSCSGVISEIKIFDQRLKVNAAIRAKTGRDSCSSENDKYATDNSVVESRVYKTHFQLPTATTASNFKSNAPAFTPGKRQSVTLLLTNATKSGPRVFDNLDTTSTDEEAGTSEKTDIKSNLKTDVPECLPAKDKQSVNSAHNFTKWSTNADSTLEHNERPILEADSADTNANSSNCFTRTPFINVTSDFGEIFEQPVPPFIEENGDASLKLTADKLVWTEPVATQSVPTQCQVDTSSQQTQTPPHACDNNELALLKCQIHNLKYSLLRAEDNNNSLLVLLKLLRKDNCKTSVVVSTQTENIIDKRQKNCLKWIHNTCTPAICHADILHTSNQKLEDEIKELKKLSRLEKDCFAECKHKYCSEIDELKSTITDLKSQLSAARTEFRDYKKNNTMLSVNKILLEQIHCNKNFYLPYLKTFEDKCKHMIWELEDLQALTSPEGTPSKAEVAESLGLWSAALADVESRQRIVMQHYETLLCNITSHQYTAVFQYPGQSLLLEPPNIMLRHFKPMLIVNRRLDREIANQMTSFYKILSHSYTNVYPQQLASVDLQSNIERAARRVKSAGDGPPQAVDSGQVPEAKAKMAGTALVTAPTAAATVPSSSAFGSAQKGTKTRQSRAPTETDAPTVQQTKRPLQDIIGLDALIEKLQSQFPLIDGAVITEALFSIRGQHGGLSGMSSKEILAEVKKYLRAKQQKNIGAVPPVNPWNAINTPVQWHSDQQDTSCTICFEKMAQDDSVTLRCQHLFHSICIKIWLHSNSICPICRSFTTLDDEFPPLKLK